MSFLANLKARYRHLRNQARATTCGSGTRLDGSIERRRPASEIRIGSECLIQGTLVTETDQSRIVISNNVFIGSGTLLDCVKEIHVDEDVLISYGCLISDSDNHSVRYSVRRKDLRDWRKGGSHDWTTTNSAPIRIGRGAWLGARCMVLKGVQIGEGGVVAAGSVVAKDVPPYCVVAGNPARIVRELGEHER